ncbi:DNA mismatch endonuclease Vsr [Acinetobacter towneri]|nr:DNA mismatch endonuclease Vsr [Acinetobacter towneri]QIV93673.1 DNA mismatch endonuclease Vsr [Acinetobacter towneri]
MAAIKGKNTQPELKVRKALHKLGFRYRLFDKRLPGKPDLVFTKHKTAVFIQGCFWHRHQCKFFKWPKTNSDFWHEKIMRNVQRDEINQRKLLEQDWKICIWWECNIRNEVDFSLSLEKFKHWILDPQSNNYLEL